MSDRTDTTDRDPFGLFPDQPIECPTWATHDVRQFIRALAFHAAPDDGALSVGSLRLILSDLREHARRLYEELQNAER